MDTSLSALVLNESQLYAFIGQYLWPFIRISALFMAMPVIGAHTVTPRIRIILAIFTTMVVSPVIAQVPTISPFSLPAFGMVVNEVLIGLALGFIFQVVLHIFVLSGQLIAMKMGLGFASMNDPSNGISVTVISQFYLLLTTVLFLVFNGHLMVIKMIAHSFASLPIGGSGLGSHEFLAIAGMGSWMFSAALVIVLPLFTAVLIINMAFGTMNRSAPQINVFTVGFPITLICGLFFLWISLSVFMPNFTHVMDHAFSFTRAILRLP